MKEEWYLLVSASARGAGGAGGRRIKQRQVLWRAAKLPIYSVAIVPFSEERRHSGRLEFQRTAVLARVLVIVVIIMWLNLSNDAYDSETGVDKNKRESVVNITGSQKGVLRAAHVRLGVGFTGLVFGASQASDKHVAVLLAAAIRCYVYQCPPFRLSYQSLGESFCFLAFGPIATTAFYLSQAQLCGTLVLPVTFSIVGASVLWALLGCSFSSAVTPIRFESVFPNPRGYFSWEDSTSIVASRFLDPRDLKINSIL